MLLVFVTIALGAKRAEAQTTQCFQDNFASHTKAIRCSEWVSAAALRLGECVSLYVGDGGGGLYFFEQPYFLIDSCNFG